MSRLIRWWTGRIRVWGRDSYIRLFPNPGFRLFRKGYEVRWNSFYGWHIGRAR